MKKKITLTASDILKGRDNMISYRNLYQLTAAIIWHLNNQGGTDMNIPNDVYGMLDKKIAQLPKDKEVTESEALELAKKK